MIVREALIPLSKRSSRMLMNICPLTRDYWIWCNGHGATFRLDADGEFQPIDYTSSRGDHDPGDEDRRRA